jgi:hypothetical protein
MKLPAKLACSPQFTHEPDKMFTIKIIGKNLGFPQEAKISRNDKMLIISQIHKLSPTVVFALNPNKKRLKGERFLTQDARFLAANILTGKHKNATYVRLLPNSQLFRRGGAFDAFRFGPTGGWPDPLDLLRLANPATAEAGPCLHVPAQ